jgi:RNA polymerase sigma-70 factor (ECF subfamily)
VRPCGQPHASEAWGLWSEAVSSDEERWADLMARAQEGDAEAYRRLLTELSTAIEAYLRRHFGDSELLEECVQEALQAVHRARHAWDAGRPFRPWLFTIVRHKAIDVLRRGARVARREVAASLDPGEDAAWPADPGAALDAERFLRGLAPRYREPLVLTKLLGYSTREAARALGISETALKTRVFRAIRLARQALTAGEPS